MTVKILSGEAAALSEPEKSNENELNENNRSDAVFTAEDVYLSDPAPVPARRHRKRSGFIGVLLFQSAVCGLLFAAAWVLMTMAPSEINEAVRNFVGSFA